jgi:hypothetical protein
MERRDFIKRRRSRDERGALTACGNPSISDPFVPRRRYCRVSLVEAERMSAMQCRLRPYVRVMDADFETMAVRPASSPSRPPKAQSTDASD